MKTQQPAHFRSGFVAIFGRPNTGKTTLLNRLCGAKLGIVSPKPQTTRSRIMGVLTGKHTQFIFLDAPGYVAGPGKQKLDERVQRCALDALHASEIALVLFDVTRAWGEEDALVAQAARASKHQMVVALNKVDAVAADAVKQRITRLREVTGVASVVAISAQNGTGLVALMKRLRGFLPAGPLYYPKDTLTDQTARFLAAEVIREQLFLTTDEEVPYGCAVLVDSYKEDETEIRIRAEILVERESLKGMIVGAGGSKIRDLGMHSRAEIGRLTGKTVHLNLFVKLHKNWRKDEKIIKQLGY